MSERLRSIASFYDLDFLPEERLRPSLSIRLHLALGGFLCLIFGVMTSFNPGLIFIDVGWPYQGCLGYPLMEFQSYPVVYSLLFIASPAGFLSLVASTQSRGRVVAILSHLGITLGLLGSFLFLLEFFLVRGGIVMPEVFLVPSLGFSMILLGISLMLVYPISLGILPPASNVPLLIPPILMFTIYPEPPIIVGFLGYIYGLYNFLLYLILPALIILIRSRIRYLRRRGQNI
ncbi:hypothetical protein CW700_07525 [Candidatus Bathyarchaeota archaeon]|nr:MAG: hypothetical protein CW700_07525 [Candidatus Bathyarchaeota archaeon]